MFNMDFDVESFIVEIKNRPCIWNTKLPDYADKILKVKMWEEVTELFAEPDFTNEERKKLGVTLQKRWRNLRDSFVKECRKLSAIKKESGTSHKPSYVYFEHLSFLKDTVVHNKRSSDNFNAITEQQILNEETMDAPSECEIPKQVKRKKRKTITVRNEDATVRNEDPIEPVLALKESVPRREEDNDPDRHFLLSLINDFRNVPEHLKLSTKIKIMKVIMDASCSDPLLQDNNCFNYPVYTVKSPNMSDHSQGSNS